MGNVLVGERAIASVTVVVLVAGRRAEEAAEFGSIVDRLRESVGEEDGEAARIATFDSGLEGVVTGLTDTDLRACHRGELGIRAEELATLNGGQAERTGGVCDDAEERIGNRLVDGTTQAGDDVGGELIVLYARWKAIGVVSGIADFRNPIPGELALDVEAPLQLVGEALGAQWAADALSKKGVEAQGVTGGLEEARGPRVTEVEVGSDAIGLSYE